MTKWINEHWLTMILEVGGSTDGETVVAIIRELISLRKAVREAGNAEWFDDWEDLAEKREDCYVQGWEECVQQIIEGGSKELEQKSARVRELEEKFERCSDHAATLGIENDKLRARVKELEDQARELEDKFEFEYKEQSEALRLMEERHHALREAVRAVRDRYHGAGVPLDDKLIRLFNMVKDDGDNND